MSIIFRDHLNVERNVFNVGDLIRVQVILENKSNSLIRFDEISMSDFNLTFTEQHMIKLLSPDGEDLLSDMEKDVVDSSLTVLPEDSIWLSFNISQNLYLTEEGEYKFRLELQDSREGELSYSAESTFTLLPLLQSEKPEDLVVNINIRPDIEPIETTFEINFANHSRQQITLLLPENASFLGWVNPVYRFVVKCEGSQIIPQYSRAVDFFDEEVVPRYDEESVINLESGQSFSTVVSLSNDFLFDDYDCESHLIQLIYLVRSTPIGHDKEKFSTLRSNNPNLFLGVTESNQIIIEDY